jgi:hypothetical protein
MVVGPAWIASRLAVGRDSRGLVRAVRVAQVARIAAVLVLLAILVLAPAASAQFPWSIPGQPQPTVVAGTGEEATDDAARGDGGPATEATFDHVDGLDWAGNGSILVADGNDGRIRHITPSGTIRTNKAELGDPIAVVSTGSYPNEAFEPHKFVASNVADDTVESWTLLVGPIFGGTWEKQVMMEDVDATDVERSGSGYWVADPGSGTVWHVSFVGFPTNQWVKTPVLEGLADPRGVGPLPGGGFLVATRDNDAHDCRIRRHTDGGTVVLAGNSGFCAGREQSGNGDGGPATAAFLRFPLDVEATPDGGFVFIERERLRRVDPNGTLSSIYLTGPVCPDCLTPSPDALEVTPDGDVLIGIDRQVLRFDTNYAANPNPNPNPNPNNPNPQPPPPPGPDPITSNPLTAALSKSSYKVAAGKKVAVVFTTAAAGTYALTIKKGKKKVKSFKGPAKSGKNTIKKKLKLKPGRYKMALKVKAGGETASDTAKLRVTPPAGAH